MSRWPSYEDDEIKAVSQVLASGRVNYWTGEECRSFEKEFAVFAETDYAVSLANGTVALEAALKALDVGIGDEVIVTSRTFMASVSSIINAGAKPIFVDIDPDTQNISSCTVESAVSPKTKAILCVHLAGWPCDMDNILDVAHRQNIFVIEDCAQAHGAKYKGRSIGSFGDVGCWSFCQDKIMTTGGEGGMITTNSQKLWSKIWSYKDHGKSPDAMAEGIGGSGFRWVHHSFGTNLRMTEIQAAIGRLQLTKMLQWQSLREKNCRHIWETASRFKIYRVPKLQCSDCHGEKKCQCAHACYKCYIFVNGEMGLRDKIVNEIVSKGVFCSTGSCSEVYLEKAFENADCRPAVRLPVAKQLGETSLMFQCHPNLTIEDLNKTCAVIAEVGLQYEDY